MILGIIFLTSLIAIDNKEYFDTVKKQLKEGYHWEEIDCRTPDETLPHIAIETPIGNKYVCHKLVK